MASNGIYEGSRIILPEHREAYLQEMSVQERLGKSLLDEQEKQQIEEVIFQTYQQCCSVTLTVFNPFDDDKIKGVVT